MSFLLSIAVVIGLIWGLILALRVSPLLAGGLYLIVASAVGYEFFNFNAGGVNLTLDRLLLVGLVLAFFVQQKLGRTSPKPIEQSEFVLFAFFALLLGNTLAHGTSSLDSSQVPIIPHLIEGYLIPLVLYWIGRRATVSQHGIQRLYGLFAIFGIYLALTAIFEATGMWTWVFPKIIADPDLGIHFGRARGPFLQSVRLGIYLLLGLAAVWIPLVWRGVWGQRGRILGICLSPLFLIAILATLTRSIWLGTAIASLLLFSLTLWGRARRVVVLSLVVVGLVGGLFFSSGFATIKREYGAAETRESTNMRFVFAYVSWLMVKERPLQGCGFGHFPHKKDSFLNDRQTNLEMESIRGYIHHNTFLSILVELGLFGLLFYTAVLCSWLRRAWYLWKDWHAPAWMRGQALLLLFLPFYLIQMMFHEISYSPLENGLLFFLAGVTSSLFTMRGHQVRAAAGRPVAAASVRSAMHPTG